MASGGFDFSILHRVLPDGEHLVLNPNLFGVQLARSVGKSMIDEAWDFDTEHVLDAYVAFAMYGAIFDMDSMPWCRHFPSNRRRPGGDRSKEYVKED